MQMHAMGVGHVMQHDVVVMEKFGSVRFNTLNLRTPNQTIRSVRQFSRTLNGMWHSGSKSVRFTFELRSNANGEFAMVLAIFGQGWDRELVRDELEVFLRDERFPKGWAPAHTLHLWEVVAISKKMRDAMARVREGRAREEKLKSGEGRVGWLRHKVEQLLDQN